MTRWERFKCWITGGHYINYIDFRFHGHNNCQKCGKLLIRE